MTIIFALLLLSPQENLESALKKLFESLTDDQKKECLKTYDDPDRDKENFVPGKRPGLPIKDLTDEQMKLLDASIKNFLSETGYKQAMEVASQSHKKEGLKAYYLNFFGDPTKDKTWAFRVSEHHLTLVHVTSDPFRFGPILLGANPPTIWKEQEEAAIKCFGKLTETERGKAVLATHALSGDKLGERGVLIGDLSKEAKEAAAAMVEARLRIFSDDQRKKLLKIMEAQGGIDTMRLAFYGEMTQRCVDGGRADWKIEGKDFLCDYESSRGHIHMTLRGKAEK